MSICTKLLLFYTSYAWAAAGDVKSRLPSSSECRVEVLARATSNELARLFFGPKEASWSPLRAPISGTAAATVTAVGSKYDESNA